jgi:hypothetical protein
MRAICKLQPIVTTLRCAATCKINNLGFATNIARLCRFLYFDAFALNMYQ